MLEFPQPVRVTQVQIQFQGGFASRQGRLEGNKGLRSGEEKEGGLTFALIGRALELSVELSPFSPLLHNRWQEERVPGEDWGFLPPRQQLSPDILLLCDKGGAGELGASSAASGAWRCHEKPVSGRGEKKRENAGPSICELKKPPAVASPSMPRAFPLPAIKVEHFEAGPV